MHPGLSLYFDLIRFLAACLVVHSHLLENGLFPFLLPGSLEFGREAVIFFFVMSGYVIAYTTDRKNHCWRDYVVARSARIYSVALPIILLSTLIAIWGINNYPELYKDFYQYEKLYFYIPFHLLFMGELANFYEKPYLVVPYWSLSYEVWYYVLFGAWFFLKGKIRIIVFLLLICWVGHRLWLLLPIWWSGVWLYHRNRKNRLPKPHAILLFIFSIALLLFFKLSGLPEIMREFMVQHWPESWRSLGSAERVLSDYVYTLIILLNFYSLSSLNFGVDDNPLWKNIIRTFASYTLTLYLCHMLIIEPVVRHFSFDAGTPFMGFSTIGGIILLTALIGYFFENKKNLFRKFFMVILDMVVPATWKKRDVKT